MSGLGNWTAVRRCGMKQLPHRRARRGVSPGLMVFWDLPLYLVPDHDAWRRGTTGIGAPNRNRLLGVKQCLARGEGCLPGFGDLLPLDDFDPAGTPPFTEEATFGSAWAHVHFLLEGGPQYCEASFAALEEQLASVSNEGTGSYAAFRAVLETRPDPPAADADFYRFITKL